MAISLGILTQHFQTNPCAIFHRLEAHRRGSGICGASEWWVATGHPFLAKRGAPGRDRGRRDKLMKIPGLVNLQKAMENHHF